MSGDTDAGVRRKWLPTEAYRFLVLCALAHREGEAVSKRSLAWETRANHYVVTKVLADLSDAGHVQIATLPEAYDVTITPAGRQFLLEHRGYFIATYGPRYEAHFRYGRRPAWASFH